MIAVCITDNAEWAEKAVVLACGLAKDTQAELCLVKMVAVQHISWLGTPLGYMDFDAGEIAHFERIAAEYKVKVSSCAFQYYALADAYVDAAVYVKANVVFATLPHQTFNLWRKFEMWRLEKRLEQQHCQLYTLEEPSDVVVWSQPIHVSAVK